MSQSYCRVPIDMGEQNVHLLTNMKNELLSLYSFYNLMEMSEMFTLCQEGKLIFSMHIYLYINNMYSQILEREIEHLYTIGPYPAYAAPLRVYHKCISNAPRGNFHA